MSYELRITQDLLAEIHADLSRPHEYAYERITFVTCRPAAYGGSRTGLLAVAAHSVADDDYEHDDSVGAMLGPRAFRRILQYAYNHKVSVLHTHRHEHRGRPAPSSMDWKEARRFVPNFWNVRPGHPHGILILSHDAAAAWIWSRVPDQVVPAQRVSVVGRRTQIYSHDEQVSASILSRRGK